MDETLWLQQEHDGPGQNSGEHPSAASLDRALESLRSAEQVLTSLKGDEMARLSEFLGNAVVALQKCQGTLRSAGPGVVSDTRLRQRARELGALNHRIQALATAARSFHTVLLRIHQTERYGCDALAAAAGVQPRMSLPHRLEMRG